MAGSAAVALLELSHVPGLKYLTANKLDQINLVVSKYICEDMCSSENHLEFIQTVNRLPVAGHSNLSHMVKGVRLEDC